MSISSRTSRGSKTGNAPEAQKGNCVCAMSNTIYTIWCLEVQLAARKWPSFDITFPSFNLIYTLTIVLFTFCDC